MAAAAWVGVVVIARDMGAMPGTMGLAFGAFAPLWALMMTAMMLPTIAPFAALYTRTFTDHRARRDRRARRAGTWPSGRWRPCPSTSWRGSPSGWSTDRPDAATPLAVGILAACGIYQLTPVKDRCLARCRSPLGFVLRYGSYRGRSRDVRVGMNHGAFCLACCWALMAVLLVAGLMNVVAMVVVVAVVVVEKTWRWGPTFGRVVGVVAFVLAVAVVFRPTLAAGLHQPTQMGADMSTHGS